MNQVATGNEADTIQIIHSSPVQRPETEVPFGLLFTIKKVQLCKDTVELEVEGPATAQFSAYHMPGSVATCAPGDICWDEKVYFVYLIAEGDSGDQGRDLFKLRIPVPEDSFVPYGVEFRTRHIVPHYVKEERMDFVQCSKPSWQTSGNW